MFDCNCGRSFTTIQGLGYHKRFCGKNKISIDNGYEFIIDSSGRMKYIHRIIIEEKLGRKLKPGEIVHHKDGNKRNNSLSNLDLTSRKRHGKHHIDCLSNEEKKSFFEIRMKEKIRKNKVVKGSNVGTSKLKEEDIFIIRERLSKGDEIKSIAFDYNVDESNIRQIKRKTIWKHI